MNAIEKAKDIIAKGKPCQMVTNTADPRVPISYRRAVSPADLLPLLRLLVECEEELAVIADPDQAKLHTSAYALQHMARALLDKLRSES